ncbi:MAG: hypothetical protein JJ858_08215 [Rhizobiaceae bacterium]|nr:hypothetical protein [Rhizobiaceae bacterium]
MRKVRPVIYVLFSMFFTAPSLAGDGGVGAGQTLSDGRTGGSGIAADKNSFDLPPPGSGWDWEEKPIPIYPKEIIVQPSTEITPKAMPELIKRRAPALVSPVLLYPDRFTGLRVREGRVGVINLTNTKLNFTRDSKLIPMEENEVITFELDGVADTKVSIRFGDQEQYTLQNGTFYKIYRNGDNWSFAKLDE